MIFNKPKQLFLGFTLLLQIAEAKVTDPLLIEVYNKFCRTEFGISDLRKIYESHPKSVNLSSLLFSDYQEEIIRMIKDDYSNYEKWDEVQRIEALDMMISNRSKDLKKMTDLLSFNSSNADIEANRKMRMLSIEILKNPEKQQFESMKEIMEKLEMFDPFLFSNYLSEAFHNKVELADIKKYYSSIDQLPNDFAMKHILLDFYSFFDDQKKAIYEINHLKTAYALCARDPAVAHDYGMALMMNEETYRNAETVFLKIIENNKYYPVNVDLSLAQIYAHFNMNEKAKIFLAKAQDAEMYLSLDAKKHIKVLQNRLEDKKKNLPLINILYLVAILVFVFFMIRKKRGNT
jgi:hypothetical protein